MVPSTPHTSPQLQLFNFFRNSLRGGANWKKLGSNVSRTDRVLSREWSALSPDRKLQGNPVITNLEGDVQGMKGGRGPGGEGSSEKTDPQTPWQGGPRAPVPHSRRPINPQPHNKCYFNSCCSPDPVISRL